jgi:hypothetical protein
MDKWLRLLDFLQRPPRHAAFDVFRQHTSIGARMLATLRYRRKTEVSKCFLGTMRQDIPQLRRAG